MLAIGIDVHSSMSTAYAVAVDEEDLECAEAAREICGRFKRFPSDRTGFSRLAEFIGDLDHCILIENSTKTHEVFWILDDLRCTVMVAYSADLYRITKSVRKTDAHDAEELAHYMRRRLLGEVEFASCLIVDRTWMNRRQICRNYAKESEILSDTRRQIRSYMLLRGMSVGDVTRDVASKRSLASLEAVADDSTALLITRARDAQARMAACLKAVEREFGGLEMYRLLLSVPGFGPVTASYLTAMIVDVGRFETGNQLAAYFGISPKQRESADSSPRCGITRRGDETARRMLLQGTFVHVNTDRDRSSPVSRMYDNLTARGFPHKKALTACANKLAHLVFGLLKSGRPYRY